VEVQMAFLFSRHFNWNVEVQMLARRTQQAWLDSVNFEPTKIGQHFDYQGVVNYLQSVAHRWLMWERQHKYVVPCFGARQHKCGDSTGMLESLPVLVLDNTSVATQQACWSRYLFWS
jgi:hypothetical protein